MGCSHGQRAGISAGVRRTRPQDDQARFGIIRYLTGANRAHVHRDELAALAALVAKPPDDLAMNLVATGR